MASQGALTLEADRELIVAIENQMITEFGHQVHISSHLLASPRTSSHLLASPRIPPPTHPTPLLLLLTIAQVIRNAVEDAPPIVALTGKLLRDEHMATLGEEAGECCTELQLRNNQIGDVGLAALAKAELPFLENISLSKNRIGDEGATALAQALRDGAWPKIRSIYLGGNKMDGEARAGLKAACKAREIDAPYL